MSTSSPINDVSDTALWVASYRAKETLRPDALFKDPLAEVLVGERGHQIAAGMKHTGKQVEWTVVIRTCIIDQYILKLISEGVDTIVNLGAGLDTRPYRMDLPSSLRWIEVDYPHMIELKNTKLANEKPKCQLERVKLDLAQHEERKQLLSRIDSQSKKILVLTEGVIPYLSEEQVGDLADDLHSQKHFQFWIAEYISPHVYRFLKGRRRMEKMKNAPFRFFPEDWIGLFERHGWKQREIRYSGEEAEKLGRPMPLPTWAKLLRFIFRPKGPKANAYQRFTGFLLLQPK